MVAVELTCYRTSNHKHTDDISVHCQTHGIVDQSESWLSSPRNEKKNDTWCGLLERGTNTERPPSGRIVVSYMGDAWKAWYCVLLSLILNPGRK